MKKNWLLPIAIFGVSLTGCSNPFIDGGTEVYSAAAIGTIAYEEERTIELLGNKFAYFNVRSDEEGNWVLDDANSYIKNNDIQFGLRFRHSEYVGIYEGDSYIPIDPMFTEYENGDYGYQVYFGFRIAPKPDVEFPEEGVSIGKIAHWR